MFDRLRKRFRRPEIMTISLDFKMDRADDTHLVQVFKHVNGQTTLVTDVEPLCHYGYREQIETAVGDPIILVLDAKDQQTLLALKSMNPRIDKSGTLAFPFVPPILNYLRTKQNIVESEDSEKLKIADKPLEAVAAIDYDPQEGLSVKTGYKEPHSTEFVPADKMQKTIDEQFVLIGDTFTPLPPELKSEQTKKWWQNASTNVPKQDIPEFFQRDLVLLKKEFTAVLTDSAAQIKIVDEPFKPVVKVDKDERGWLDFDVSYAAGDLLLPHEMLSQVKQETYLQLDDLTWVKNKPGIVRKTEKRLQDLGAEWTGNSFRAPVSEFASLEEFIKDIGGKAELSAAYQAFLEQLTGFNADENFRLSPAAERQFKKEGIVLRPYQRAGIHWLDWLFNNHLHGLLADDMGLGKTLQAISVLRRAYEKKLSRQPSLILAPKSVLYHWEREINRFYPQLRVYAYHGPRRNKNLFNALEPILFISTYMTVANDIEDLKLVPFYYLILDEATRIKNPQTKRTQAAKALNAAHRVALSGTPVENRPAEMWSVFDFLMRGHLGRYGTFTRLFENQITAGDKQAVERLGRRVRPFMLRRLKSEVAQDLPEKIEMDEWCELTSEQRQLYGSLQEQTKGLYSALSRGEDVNYTASILPVLTKLKQICDHPALVTKNSQPLFRRSEKFDWVVDKIRTIKAQGEQVVLFSHFLDMLNLLETAVLQDNTSYIRIDGSTNKRQALIDEFNSGRKTVALCSLTATSYGINLQSANHVIHADRWWNPAIEDQATDRVHRIGQDKTVYVYRIMVQGTLEERIDKLLANKRQVAGQIVDAAGAGTRQWTRAELLELLRPLD